MKQKEKYDVVSTPDRDLDLVNRLALQPARNDAVSREIFDRIERLVAIAHKKFFNMGEEDREDAASIARLKIFQELTARNFHGGVLLETWAWRIIFNSYIDAHRKKTKSREFLIHDEHDEADFTEWSLEEDDQAIDEYRESEIEEIFISEDRKRVIESTLRRIMVAEKDSLIAVVDSALLSENDFFKPTGLFDLKKLFEWVQSHEPESLQKYRQPYQEVRRAWLALLESLKLSPELAFI